MLKIHTATASSQQSTAMSCKFVAVAAAIVGFAVRPAGGQSTSFDVGVNAVDSTFRFGMTDTWSILFSLENVYYDEHLNCTPKQAFRVTDVNGNPLEPFAIPTTDPENYVLDMSYIKSKQGLKPFFRGSELKDSTLRAWRMDYHKGGLSNPVYTTVMSGIAIPIALNTYMLRVDLGLHWEIEGDAINRLQQGFNTHIALAVADFQSFTLKLNKGEKSGQILADVKTTTTSTTSSTSVSTPKQATIAPATTIVPSTKAPVTKGPASTKAPAPATTNDGVDRAPATSAPNATTVDKEGKITAEDCSQFLTTCTFTTGDGTGDSEEQVATTASKEECETYILANHPTANGATWSLADSRCYAEYGMSGQSEDPAYVTCTLVKARQRRHAKGKHDKGNTEASRETSGDAALGGKSGTKGKGEQGASSTDRSTGDAYADCQARNSQSTDREVGGDSNCQYGRSPKGKKCKTAGGDMQGRLPGGEGEGKGSKKLKKGKDDDAQGRLSDDNNNKGKKDKKGQDPKTGNMEFSAKQMHGTGKLRRSGLVAGVAIAFVSMCAYVLMVKRRSHVENGGGAYGSPAREAAPQPVASPVALRAFGTFDVNLQDAIDNMRRPPSPARSTSSRHSSRHSSPASSPSRIVSERSALNPLII